MGDRTWVVVNIGKGDVTRAELVSGDLAKWYTEKEEVQQGWTIYSFEEFNYGGEELRNILIESKIPFCISWGAGSSYGSGMAIYDGEQMVKVMSSGDGEPLVAYTRLGLDTDQLKDAKLFWELDEKVYGAWKNAS